MKVSELSDDPFQHTANWPELCASVGEVNKKQHKWIGVLIKEFVALKEQCAELKKENSELASKLASLEKANNELVKNTKEKGTGSWASLFSSKDGKRSEEQLKFLAAVAKESRVVTKTECNLIINGLPEPDAAVDEMAMTGEDHASSEQRQLTDLLSELGVDCADVETFKRLKSTKPAPGTDDSSTARTRRPCPVLVQFKNALYRDRALQSASRLRDSALFKGVFLDIDKTKAERSEEYKLRKERDARNSQLPNVVEGTEGRQRYGTDGHGKKFYYGIRYGVIKKVFMARA